MEKQTLWPLKAEELLITTYRGDLPANQGGHYLRITHQPTGISVEAPVTDKQFHSHVEQILIQDLKRRLRDRGLTLIAEWGAVIVFLIFISMLWGGYFQ